jgi:hypothetical protein
VLAQPEKTVENDADHEPSVSNRAATQFPICVLLHANEACQRGQKFTFSD